MKSKVYIKAIAVMLVIVSLSLCCIVGVSAATEEIYPGEIIIRMDRFVEFSELLPEFEIKSTVLLTPNSDMGVYKVSFYERTKDIVTKAIEKAYENPMILFAGYSTQNGLKGVLDIDYAPGDILFSAYPANAVEILAAANEIGEVEEFELLMPLSDGTTIYCISFVEKTKDIVWDAIEVLSKNELFFDVEINVIYSLETDPIEPVQGDADGDGMLTVLDATVIQQYLADLVSDDYLDLDLAKVIGDGELSVMDATMIQRILAQLV